MKAQIAEIIDDCSGMLASLGFTVKESASHSTTWARPDGFRLSLEIEHQTNAFSVELLPPGSKAGSGMSAALLMAALEPERMNRIRASQARGCDATDYTRLWWYEFIEFLHNRGCDVLRYPLEQSIVNSYQRLCARELRRNGLQNLWGPNEAAGTGLA